MNFKCTIACDDEKAVLFAASELDRYLCVMFSDKIPNYNFCLKILHENDEYFSELNADDFAIFKKENQINIVSKLARGVLYGVYEFLETQGCRFIIAANINEYIPSVLKIVKMPDKTIFKGSLKVRGFTFAGGNSKMVADECIKIIDFCAKRKINSIFLHQTMRDEINGDNKRVADEIIKRGMTLEFGGHLAQEFIDKSLFYSNPELFIEKDNKRIIGGKNRAVNAWQRNRRLWRNSLRVVIMKQY